MHKLLLLTAVAFFATAGCSAVSSASGKSQSIHGAGLWMSVDSGYDNLTGSYNPASVNMASGSVRYKSTIMSIPEGSKPTEYIDISVNKSSSWLNSSAVSYEFSLTATSGDSATIKDYLDKGKAIIVGLDEE